MAGPEMRQIGHGINVFGFRTDCVDFNHIGGCTRVFRIFRMENGKLFTPRQ